MKTKQKFFYVLLLAFSFFTGFYANNHGWDTKSMYVLGIDAFWVLLHCWYFHIFINSEGRTNVKKDTKTRNWFMIKMGGVQYLLNPNWECVHQILNSMSIRRLYQLRRGYMQLHAHYSDWGEFDSPRVDLWRVERKCEVEKVIELIDKYLPPQKLKRDEDDED